MEEQSWKCNVRKPYVLCALCVDSTVCFIVSLADAAHDNWPKAKVIYKVEFYQIHPKMIITYLRGKKSFQYRAKFLKKIVWHYFSIFVTLLNQCYLYGQSIGKTKSNLKILTFSHMFHTTFFIPTFVFKFPRFWTKLYSKTERIQCRFFFLSRIQRRKELDVKNWNIYFLYFMITAPGSASSSIKSFSHGSLSLWTILSRSTLCKVVMGWMKYEFTRQIIFLSKSLCSYYLANIN